MRAHSSRDLPRAAAIALLAVLPAVLPSNAAAAQGTDDLSPRLAELASPSLRDASPARQARALDLTRDGLARRGRQVLADVRFGGGALAARDELREAGAKTIGSSGRYQTVTVALLPQDLRAISRVPGVEGVTPVFAPRTSEPCPSGEVVSEGDAQLKADQARKIPAPLEYDGSDVTVGVLSDSFDQATEAPDGSGDIATHAGEDVESGDLPGEANPCGHTAPVDVLDPETDPSEASDEGRAMAQIVHDLAPGAELDFASAFNGEISFANNIRALAAAEADVIVDDVFYPGEPFFQDGPVAVAVKEVTEGGVPYFSAAGNDNLIDAEGHDIGSWETPAYRDAGSCPAAVRDVPGANGFHCLDFNPGAAVDRTFGIKVEAGETLAVDLQWDEPWNEVETDIDAFLLNANGELLRESREKNVSISQEPIEFFEWTNTSSGTRTVQLVANRRVGGDPRVKFALIQNGGGVEATEYPQSSGEDVVGPTIFGHSGSASAISVGAVPFNNASKVERYSSRGPVRHDYGPIVDGTPAPPLGSPEILSKPDLVATDCGKTTFFAILFQGFWHFCGTSAAAPHAAAVAALMLDAEPAADPEGIRAALYGSAQPVGAFGTCAVGSGLVEAVGAVQKALAEEGGVGPTCKPPTEEVDPEEAAAPGDWGSETPPPTGESKFTPPIVEEPPVEPPPVAAKPRPRTFFLQRPAKVVRTLQRRALAVFLFGSNESDVSFACRVDGGFFRPCAKRLARRFSPGWHLVEVAARNAEGLGDRSPARYRFKVRRAR